MHIVAAALAIAGLAGTLPPDTTSTNDPELEMLLLTVDDMPTGWSEGDPDFFDDDEPDSSAQLNSDPCADANTERMFPTGFDDGHRAEVSFVGNTMFDRFGQAIVEFHSNDQADDLIDTMEQLIEICPTTTGDDGGTATIGEMSFPDLGDRTVAIRVVDSSLPIPAAFVIVVVDDRATVLFGIGEGGNGELLEQLTRTAVGRIT